MIKMTARYNGTCALCAARIAPGTPILWSKNTREVVHSDRIACDDQMMAKMDADAERRNEQHAYQAEMDAERAAEEAWEMRMEDLAIGYWDDLNNA